MPHSFSVDRRFRIGLLWVVGGVFAAAGGSFFWLQHRENRSAKAVAAEWEWFQKKESPSEEAEILRSGRVFLIDHAGTESAARVSLHLAQVAFQKGRFEESRDLLQGLQGTMKRPLDRALLFAQLGFIAESLGRWEEGIVAVRRAFDEAQSLDPAVAKALKGDWLLLWARCEEGRKAWKEARRVYGQVIQELPQSSFSQIALMAQDGLPHEEKP